MMEATSNIFDFKRFGLNLKRDLCYEGRSWLLRLLMFTGVLTAAMIIVTLTDAELSIRAAARIFHIFAMLFCALGASLFMNNMSSNGQRLNQLMTPASQTEKFLTRWLICIVGVTFCYIVCFAIADFLRVAILSVKFIDNCELQWVGPFAAMRYGVDEEYFWVALIALQSTFLLGSTVWPKDSFRKTLVVLIVIGVVCGFIFTGTFAWLMSNYVFYSKHTGNIQHTIFFTIQCWVQCAWIVFCNVVAWFRFRESEIIHRF